MKYLDKPWKKVAAVTLGLLILALMIQYGCTEGCAGLNE
jgi:hypothetical protein